ncbi:MAG: CPBP family intramembrane glutamic endopeptidase [Bacteroidota bacterium]
MQPLQLISKYAICYGIFFLLTYITKLNDGNKFFDQKGIVRNPGALAGLQIAGILWFGFIPANIFDESFISMVFGNHLPGLLKMSVLIMLVMNAIILSSTQSENEFIRIVTQKANNIFITRGFAYRYFIFRIVFLIAYEAWFRGYLLTDCVTAFGIPLAIFINVSLYTILHSFSGRKEIIGCIPFGILLCTLCTWFGAAWPAIIMHVALAFTYEYKLADKFLNPKNILA